MTMVKESDSDYIKTLESKVQLLERRVTREVAARKEAERILESKSMDLYSVNKALEELNVYLGKNYDRRNEALSRLIDHLTTGILLTDENGKIILANHSVSEILGLKENQKLEGKDHRQLAQSLKQYFRSPSLFIDIINQNWDDRSGVQGQEIVMRTGQILELDMVPVFSDKEFLGQIWQMRDVTEQRNIQQRIEESEEKYRGIIENMQLGLMEVDLDHKIQRAYKAFCQMTGYQEQELLGRDAREVFLPEDYDEIIKEQDRQRIEGKQSVYEIQIRKKNGQLLWVLISGSPIYDAKGEICGSIGIHYDVSARKQLEMDLTDARNVAEKARAAEKEFLANMSHEIRNPINAIVGITNLLYDTGLNQEQLDHLNNIKYSADILLGLISGILDISKIESGNIELVERETNLEELMDGLIQVMGFKSQHKPIHFMKDFDSHIDFSVMADTTILNQIFLNLLSNATKFTQEGTVTLTSELLREDKESAQIRFTVSDTGIGIPSEKLQQIFDSFQQADSETKLTYGGTGLVLTIVRNLVKLYQGSITAINNEDKGATFIFDLVFKKSMDTGREMEETIIAPTGHKRILIVEDNIINQQYLGGLLKKWRLEYEIAENGQIALNKLEKNRFDLILMDIRMPQMDGYEATIRLRSAPHNVNHRIPIIALTASALVDEKEKALAVGMNYHITKPFTPEQLVNALSKFDIVSASKPSEQKVFEFSSRLDRKQLSELYREDLQHAEIMFGLFLNVIDEEFSVLTKQLEAEDWNGFSAQAHKLKSNFSMVGLSSLSDRMNRYESAKKFADLRSDIKARFSRTQDDFKISCELIRAEHARLSTYLSK
jgi:PAS domain S-box-containing protein